MLVIADSSPFIVLTKIGHIDVLPALFGQVTIPPQVELELLQGSQPSSARNFIVRKPNWLHVQAPTTQERIPLLEPGEMAAIQLAQELKADLLLIDETHGRKIARECAIPITGTVGVLELATKAKLLNLKAAFELLKQTDFWISHELLDERLKLYQAEGNGS